MTNSPVRFSPRTRAVLLLALGFLASACATAKPAPDLRWPLPPDPARVKFVRAFREDDDLKPSTFSRMMRTLFAAPGAAQIDQPSGLALSPDDRFLYVVSPSATPIIAVDLLEGKVRSFGTSAEARPGSAYGVAVDGEGRIYVTDSARNAVRVYSKEGRQLQRIEERMQRPTGIAIDRRRKLLYVVSGVSRESTDHRVEVFSLEGKHLRTIGTRGSEGGQFNFPTNVGVTRDGLLYVVDMLNFRIQIFDPEGNLQGMFGSPGNGPGLFDKAKGIAFDSFDNVYVSDSQLGLVQMFNSKNQVLMAFGGKLAKVGYMLVPTSLAITSKNTIFVADYAAKTVSEYQLIDTTAEDSFKALAAPPAASDKAAQAPASSDATPAAPPAK